MSDLTPKAIVFDLGGTLMEYVGMPNSWVDYYPQGFHAINFNFNCQASQEDIALSVKILRNFNPRINYREEELPPEYLFSQAMAHWQRRPPASQAAQAFFVGLDLKSIIYPDVIPCLEKLGRNGIKTAALTDLPSAMPDEFFCRQITNLLPLLDCYMSSATCGFRKPNRRGLELIAAALDILPADMVFIGDEAKDALTAGNYGCTFIRIERAGKDDTQLSAILDAIL